MYVPVGGTVTAINDALINAPETINTDPYQSGWMIKVKPDNADGFAKLMDAIQYENLLKEEH